MGAAKRQAEIKAWLGARKFEVAVSVIALVGLGLRYYSLPRQIVLDDEWHGLQHAASEPWWQLASNLYRYANSTAVNVYYRLVLDAWGWSEVSLRMHSVLATVVTLLLFPRFVRRGFDSTWMALCCAVLFSLSQFFIFYAQSGRPYACYFCLLVTAFFAFERALTTNQARAWLTFAVCGAFAAWFHLYALAAIGPLGAVALARVYVDWRNRSSQPSFSWRVSLGGIALGFGAWALISLALFAPALLRGVPKGMVRTESEVDLGPEFWKHTAEILTGCRFPWLGGVFAACAVAGLLFAARQRPWLTATLITGAASALAFTLIVRPEQVFVPLVLLRYNLGLFLLYFVCLSAFAERVSLAGFRLVCRLMGQVRPELFSSACLVALAVLAFLTSPTVRELGYQPNNFRLHNAFQESYSTWSADHIFVSDAFKWPADSPAEVVPEFYTQARRFSKPCTLVEYPMMRGDDQNPYYFYQLRHRCDVVVGYSRTDPVGVVLTSVEDRNKLRFRQLVDLEDPVQLKQRGVDFVVVHRDVLREIRALNPSYRKRRLSTSHRRVTREARRVAGHLTTEFGAPVYEDQFLAVFSVRGPKSAQR